MTQSRDLCDPTHPDRLQPEQRLTEVARILAAGVMRMREHQNQAATSTLRIPPESGDTRLELSRRTRPDGQGG